MDLLCMVGIGLFGCCSVSLCSKIYITVITVLFSIKYISRVNFDSTYRKIKVENTILRFLPLKYSAS